MERKQLIPVVAQGGSSPVLQSKTVTPTTLSQTVTADQNYDGLSSVTVNATPLQAKAATPSTSQQTISPDENYVGLSAVAIGAVTSAIDANITAGNIKKDVTILGVTGTYEGGGGTNPAVPIVEGTATNITLSDLAGATKLKTYLFYADQNIKSVVIPNTVTSLGSHLFDSSKIESITFENDSQVTSLPSDFCTYCNKLTSITIPKSVSTIYSSFQACTGLTSVTFEHTTESLFLSNYAFYGCTNLVNISLPSNTTGLSTSCFANCSSLTSITIPASITVIGSSAFANCTSLTSVTVLNTTPPTLQYTNAFSNTTCTFYVPAESVAIYKAASGWSTYASRIQAIPNS